MLGPDTYLEHPDSSGQLLPNWGSVKFSFLSNSEIDHISKVIDQISVIGQVSVWPHLFISFTIKYMLLSISLSTTTRTGPQLSCIYPILLEVHFNCGGHGTNQFEFQSCIIYFEIMEVTLEFEAILMHWFNINFFVSFFLNLFNDVFFVQVDIFFLY